MSGRRLRRKRELTPPPQPSSISTNRPRRAAAQASAAATAANAARDRDTDSPDELRLPGPSSVKLKVGSRLREVEGPGISSARRGDKTGATGIEGREGFAGRRAQKKAIVEESSEDEDDEEDALGDEDDEDDEDADDADDAVGDGDDDEDDEDEDDAEGDEDVEMDDAPAHLPTKVAPAGRLSKPSVTITPAKRDTIRSVEDQEMAMDGSDDELSELDSSQELEDQDGGELDAEADEDEELDAEGDEDAEGDSESDGGTPSMSRMGTPDPTKMTRRQRGEMEGGLMALSNEAQKKKHLTAEEHAARRAEMARRRKNLSEKRNEEEKMDTINRLLKKQAPKRRSRKEIEAENLEEGLEHDGPRAPAIYVRWVNSVGGSKVAVPYEYLDADSVGPLFRGGVTGGKITPFRGRMVEEVPIEAN